MQSNSCISQTNDIYVQVYVQCNYKSTVRKEIISRIKAVNSFEGDTIKFEKRFVRTSIKEELIEASPIVERDKIRGTLPQLENKMPYQLIFHHLHC